ncbi:MAG: efflux RND transporter periplasmic adaptor subunit [Candidatus Competibacter sp.]|nr:efflux RND transporter periplasmic adaptor subunit [Candidatus Competibacter sp.]MDG4605827.1 efflux RND transporter periplasmic adaptor subunit [Candidatus Contendobacter sp.]HRD50219.1 efflux RND transporter periplasmic adaptor subunit [Candidatus Contendobacter sp.]
MYQFYPWSAAGSGKTVRAAPPAPVKIASAAIRDVPLVLEVFGRAEAYDSVTLKARVDGQVAALPFVEGQTVASGAVLARLDPADFDARLRQAEANLARDQAQLVKARLDVDRYLSLKNRSFVSEQQVAEARANADALAATVRADQAAVESTRLQQSYATIQAPFAGVIGARLVSPGATVKANDTALAVLNRVQPLYVSFAVPERYLPRLRAALRTGGLPVMVAVPGAAGQRFPGEARFLDNAVDPATGAIQMKATIANAAETLTPGQFLNVSLTLEVIVGAVTAPAEAVQQGPEGSFVFVVKPDRTVEVRPVAVTLMQSGIAVIGQGLRDGETVVTDGQLRLSPGAKVQVQAGG